MRCFLFVKVISTMPNVGPELMTLRLSVPCSTGCASHVPRWRGTTKQNKYRNKLQQPGKTSSFMFVYANQGLSPRPWGEVPNFPFLLYGLLQGSLSLDP